MEKGEIAHFEKVHLFPQCFPEAFFFNVLKGVFMEERVDNSSMSDSRYSSSQISLSLCYISIITIRFAPRLICLFGVLRRINSISVT